MDSSALCHVSLIAHHATDTDSGDSCFAQIGLEAILLELALGHSLKASRSRLARLPREVLEHCLVQHVRCLFMQDLRCRGLLTPVESLEASMLSQPAALSRQPPPLVRRARVRTTQAPIGTSMRHHLNNFGICTKKDEDDDDRTALASIQGLRVFGGGFAYTPTLLHGAITTENMRRDASMNERRC